MKNSKPLVSVVVPSYNHEKYVKETIVSILNQTYKNIEIIVIDDGSKDNSVNIIQDLSDEYGFTFIHRANKGLSATLNEGIDLSKGKYFCVCASDDIFLPIKIEKEVEFMESHPEYSMCHSNIMITDGIKTNKVDRKRDHELGFEDLLFANEIAAPSVMLRKDVFDIVGCYDESLYVEDWDMWLRIANEGLRIGFIDDYLAIYRIHSTNISKNFDKVVEADEKILNKWNSHPLYEKALQNLYLGIFAGYSLYDKKKALKYLKYAILKIWEKRAIRGIIKIVLPIFLVNRIKHLKKIVFRVH